MPIRMLCGSAWRRVAALPYILPLAGALAHGQPLPAGRGPEASPPPVRTARTETVGGAPVVLDGDTLFHLYGSLGAFTPRERADAASRRLTSAARRLGTGVDTIVVADAEARTDLLLGETMLMTVLDADAAPIGAPRTVVAQRYAALAMVAARRFTYRYSVKALVAGIGYAVAATLVLMLLLIGIRWLFTKLYRWLGDPHTFPAAWHLQRFELISASRLSGMFVAWVRFARMALTVLLCYVYLTFVLGVFPWTAGYAARIAGYVTTPLLQTWSAVVAYIPDAFFILVVIVLTRYVLKVVHRVFQALETGAIHFDGFHQDWAAPTYKLSRILVFAFAGAVIFPHLPNAHSPAFEGISIVLGVLASLGSSGAVSNIVAGVVLTYTRGFQIGDRVKIGDAVGDVTARTLFVTRIRTVKNVEVTIPNGAVLSHQVINYSTLAATRGLILHTTVTIGYDVPWRQVHALLIAAARATPNVLVSPEPFVLQTSLDDFYVSYQLNAYTDQPQVMAKTYSGLHQNIQEQFNEAGVEMLSPHYGAQRDGNQIALPLQYLPPSYEAPAFRIRSVNGEPASVKPVG